MLLATRVRVEVLPGQDPELVQMPRFVRTMNINMQDITPHPHPGHKALP